MVPYLINLTFPFMALLDLFINSLLVIPLVNQFIKAIHSLLVNPYFKAIPLVKHQVIPLVPLINFRIIKVAYLNFKVDLFYFKDIISLEGVFNIYFKVIFNIINCKVKVFFIKIVLVGLKDLIRITFN